MTHRYIKIGATTAVLVLAFTGLLWSTLREGTEYYKHVDEVMTDQQAWQGKRLQLHGHVVANSILRKPNTLEWKFKVQNNGKIINARYTRRLPTLFTTNYRLDSNAAPKKASVRVAGRTTMVPKSSLDRGPDAAPLPEETALLSSRLPPMLVSRLYEMAQPVVLDAVEDFRREQAVHGARLR